MLQSGGQDGRPPWSEIGRSIYLKPQHYRPSPSRPQSDHRWRETEREHRLAVNVNRKVFSAHRIALSWFLVSTSFLETFSSNAHPQATNKRERAMGRSIRLSTIERESEGCKSLLGGQKGTRIGLTGRSPSLRVECLERSLLFDRTRDDPG